MGGGHLRRLVIALVAVILVLVGVDAAARAYAERRAGDVLMTSLGAAERPAVSLGGFPFVVGAARGRVPSLTVAARDATIEDIEVASLSMTVNDVDVSLSDLMSGTGTIQAHDGTGTATLTGLAVTHALRAKGVLVTVVFQSGQTMVTPDDTHATVTADVSLTGSTLTVRPIDAAIPSFTMSLPELFTGIRFTDVVIRGSLAHVAFDLEDPEFQV